MNNSAPRIASREGFLEEVTAALGDALLHAEEAVQEVNLTIARERLVEACRTLRDRFEYQQLMEIAGCDYPSREERFDVVYHLLSVTGSSPTTASAATRSARTSR
jgi:NADH-quinone oxidoreductase subunit C